MHEARLADTRVSNDDQLEQVVLSESWCSLVGRGQDFIGDACQLDGIQIRGSNWLVVTVLSTCASSIHFRYFKLIKRGLIINN